MTKLQKFFQDTSEELISNYNKPKGIQHNGLKCSNREFLVSNFLKRSFPRKFIFGTDEVDDGFFEPL